MITKKIAILGLPGSGKTTFLGASTAALSLNNSKWRMRGVGNAIRYFHQIHNRIFSEGRFPEKTTELLELDLVFEKDARTLGLEPGGQFKVSTFDIPGAATEGKMSEFEAFHETYHKLIPGCSGIIFLLDPKEIWLQGKSLGKNKSVYYHLLFSSILSELQAEISDIPTVFCLTKIDYYLSSSRGGTFTGSSAEVKTLTELILGKATVALIDHAFNPNYLLWTAISSIGLTNNKESQAVDSIQKEMVISKIRNRREIRPIGIVETLEWLLDKIAQRDESEAIRRTRGKRFADSANAIRKLLDG